MLHNHFDGPTAYDSFLEPSSCTDEWCVDLYLYGPFMGSLLSERLGFLQEELIERPGGPLLTEFPELELEADALEWAISTIEKQVGPEWADRLYSDEEDEDWIREDFISDDTLEIVGTVDVAGNHFSVWR